LYILRPKSPSLLRTGGGGDDEEELESVDERPESPVILNLPPVVQEPIVEAFGRRSNSTSSSTTGGSATYVRPSTLVVDLEKEDGECDTTIDSTVVKNSQEQICIGTFNNVKILL